MRLIALDEMVNDAVPLEVDRKRNYSCISLRCTHVSIHPRLPFALGLSIALTLNDSLHTVQLTRKREAPVIAALATH
jgi:hypothetical protein